jgi:hypothetical protein
MAEKNGGPFPLLSNVQGNAISSDVVLLENGAVDASNTFRSRHSTQHQTGTHGRAAREEGAARNSWPKNHPLPCRCDVRHTKSCFGLGLAGGPRKYGEMQVPPENEAQLAVEIDRRTIRIEHVQE